MAVAKMGSFSKAAEQIHITQSALSQRVKALEEDLCLTLFLRTPTGISLTEPGERLLRYCQCRDSMEEELLRDMSLSQVATYSGVVRVASYSSVFRSVVIPALTPFLQENSGVRVELICAQVPELPEKLQRAEVDFIIMDYKLNQANIETITLGREKYVAIESRGKSYCPDVFLDNNASDPVTADFFKAQKGKPPKYLRSYFDDCYGIIDSVSQGLGRAVIAEHLVRGNDQVKILKPYRPIYFDVVLHHYRQPIYSKLHKAVKDCLYENCRHLLS